MHYHWERFDDRGHHLGFRPRVDWIHSMSTEDDYPDEYTVDGRLNGWRSMSFGVIDRWGVVVAQFDKREDAEMFMPVKRSHPVVSYRFD
jgi:hypothetical protein